MINIDSLQTNFYGDKHRWWIGVVIDNQDPLRVGRIRVRIYGIHNEDKNEVPDNALPWAQVVIPPTEDGVSGLGRQVGLKPGAQVFGMFLDGSHSQVPLIIGSMPRFEQIVKDESVYVAADPAVPVAKPEPAPAQTTTAASTTTTTAASTTTTAAAPTTTEGTNRTQPKQPDKPKPPNTKSTSALAGATNAEKAYNYLISFGFPAMHAAIIVGNYIYVSDMNPGFGSKKPKPGPGSFQEIKNRKVGIAGWGPTKVEYDADPFCAERGLDFQTLETQLLFATYDMEIWAGLYGINQFVEISNIKQANEFWVTYYHGNIDTFPDDSTAPARLKIVKEVNEKYNGN